MTILTILTACIAIILSLTLIVGLHEAGHALAARCFGVKIERISIGFGKRIFTYQKKHGVEWVWARWPLGGYVKLLSHRITPVPIQAYHQCFDKQPAYARIIILASGAFTNILVAWLAFVFMFMLGYQQTPAIVHDIVPESIAARADLKPHDRIIEIAGIKTPAWHEAGMALLTHLGQANVPILIQNPAGTARQSQFDLSQVHPKTALLKSLGMTLAPDAIQQTHIPGAPFGKACQQAFHQIIHLSFFFLLLIKQLITLKLPLSLLLGPLGLFASMAHSFQQGLSVFTGFIGTLSMAVAVANLLPIPGLDGASIAYAALEKIRQKPLSVALEVLLHQLAFILFCLLLVQLILNDLVRFIN